MRANFLDKWIKNGVFILRCGEIHLTSSFIVSVCALETRSVQKRQNLQSK